MIQMFKTKPIPKISINGIATAVCHKNVEIGHFYENPCRSGWIVEEKNGANWLFKTPVEAIAYLKSLVKANEV